jgi:hypothetical protein
MPCKRSSQLSYIPIMCGKYSIINYELTNFKMQTFKKSVLPFLHLAYFYPKIILHGNHYQA